MHAPLGLQVSVSIDPANQEGRIFQTGDLSRQRIDDFSGVPLLLGPTKIHAKEHLHPVARFCAACSRVDLHDRIACVVFLAEHGGQFEIPQEAPGTLEFRANLLLVGAVVLFFRSQLYQNAQVFQLLRELAPRFHRLSCLSELSEHLLCLFRVVPEVRLCRLLL